MFTKLRKRIAELIQPKAPPRKQQPKAKAEGSVAEVKPSRITLARAIQQLRESMKEVKPYNYPVAPPNLMPGVVPSGETAQVAMDASAYEYARTAYASQGFPGYPYLASLATRAEYRAFAGALSTEHTREWIEFTSTSSEDDESVQEKIAKIETEFNRLGVRSALQKAVEQDAMFGRAQLFIEIEGQDRVNPLILSKNTVPVGSLKRIVPIEAMWTSPNQYNALDPASPDFYRPQSWFMMGQKVHASRLLTTITRPVPDMLKPAFNFGGISLSQLAEPYVDNWLRTRQSVSDLINNFSITALQTSMDQVLTGGDASGLIARAELFTLTRSNKGLMLLDKDREDLVQVNTPLSGLHELQSQSQEQMCAVSRIPSMILTGISPSGLNASSDGEIRAWYDWVAASQEAHWRDPLEVILKLVQLSLFGDIDETIKLGFKQLWQQDDTEETNNRKTDADTAAIYIDRGVLDPAEVREKISRDKKSGYAIDPEVMPIAPGMEDMDSSQGEQDGDPEEKGQVSISDPANAETGNNSGIPDPGGKAKAESP